MLQECKHSIASLEFIVESLDDLYRFSIYAQDKI